MFSRANLLPKSIVVSFFVLSGMLAALTWAGVYSHAGTIALHTGAEAVATVLAFVVGISLLTRYAISGGSKTLLLGLGFAGTGFLDGYHGIVSSAAFVDAFPTVLDSLAPWSWVPSRLHLGAMFVLVAFGLPFLKDDDQRSRNALMIGGFVAAFTIASFLLFALVPLPKAQFDVLGIGRPQELVPAALFAAALVKLLQSSDWKNNSYDMWLILVVLANLFAQVLFMPFSDQLFDTEFGVAHIFKIISYVAMFTAVMTDLNRTIASEREATDQLDALGTLQSVTAQEIMPDLMFPVVAEQIATLISYDRLTISTKKQSGSTESAVLVFETGVKLLDRSPGTVIVSKPNENYRLPGSDNILIADVGLLDVPDLDAASAGLKAWAEVPLLTGGESVGMLSVRSKNAGAYSQRDLELLESVASYIAPVVKNALIVERILKSEQQLKEQSEELRNSNESLEQFAYVASHDLQEPLRKISAFGDRLQTSLEGTLSEKSADYLVRMISAANRMQDLVQGLLEFSRVGSATSTFRSIDLLDAVRGAQESLNLAIAESGAEFDISDLGTVYGSEVQLRQVFANLIMNSIRYQRDGVSPGISISASRSNSEITVRYSDNGQGFETQYEQQIFEIFKRLHTREEVPGTGLGLALCRRIIEKHHGSITAHGNPGSGAVFLIKLPVAVPAGLAEESEVEQSAESTDAA